MAVAVAMAMAMVMGEVPAEPHVVTIGTGGTARN